MSDSLQPHGLKPTKLLCPWDSPGLSFPPPADLPDPGIKPMSLVSPALAGRLFTTSVKQYSFTILQFLQVRILGMTQLDLPLRSHEAEIVVLTGAASSFYAAFAWGSIPDSHKALKLFSVWKLGRKAHICL